MTIPINSWLTEMGIMLGDDTEVIWTPAQKFVFLKRAYRIAWPDFYQPFVDTTYTGASAIPALSGAVDVPGSFLPGNSTSEINLPGEVHSLRVRLTNTSSIVEPMNVPWFWLSRADIDPLALLGATPQIRFLQSFNAIFEMEVHGGQPLTIPAANDGTALSGSDNAGFMEWLTCQVMVFCMQSRETQQTEDKRGYGRRRLLDQSDADKMRSRYRMAKMHYTNFVGIER